MKYYKQFYEVGCNKYHTLNIDDEVYIATESAIKFKKQFLRKQKELVQGLKLLKFTPEIAMLFQAIVNTKEKRHKKDTPEEFIQYTKIYNKDIKKSIVNSYKQVYNDEYARLEKYRQDLEKNITNIPSDEYEKLLKNYEVHKEHLDKMNYMPDNIDLTEQLYNDFYNCEHLYTEHVTPRADNVFLYEYDCFGQVTIYRIFEVMGVIKCVDTFIYDRKLINKLFETMYKEGR